MSDVAFRGVAFRDVAVLASAHSGAVLRGAVPSNERCWLR